MMKAILTGQSRGIGAALASQFLSRGIPVLGLARSRNAELGNRFPDLLQQIELDLADSSAVSAWLAGECLGQFLTGCESVALVNNAGMVQPVGPLPLQDPSDIARAVMLNVATPLMLASAMAAASAHAKDRRIMHISSGAGRNAYSGWSVYCATKAAVDHHARSVALDQTPSLRICSMAPGVIDTDMQAEIRSTSLERFPNRARFEAMKRNGELAAPEECAQRLVDYLLSEEFGQLAVADLREVSR